MIPEFSLLFVKKKKITLCRQAWSFAASKPRAVPTQRQAAAKLRGNL
jgi:hypothetical protein